MATFEAAPGIIVRTPPEVLVRSTSGRTVRGGGGAARAAPEIDALKEALSAADFTLAAQVDLEPRTRGARTLRRARGITPTVEVKVGPSEGAIVLLEGTGGVYGWTYSEAKPAPRSRTRARERTLVFNLVPGAEAGPARRRARGARRGVVLDWIADKLTEPVRAYVLKFVTRKVIDIGVDYIEGDEPNGLVALTGEDPAQWHPGGAALPLLPKDRPVNILLMVHGTFSSTAGSFGALAAQDRGRAFLAEANARYDAVLGFDHKTLAQTPEMNAGALMSALETLHLPQGSSIDAVAYSRGGLVYRVLAEDLLAKRRPDIKLGKAIFIGATNSGTHLAEPKNWAAMVDLYTNLVLAGSRAVSSLAGAAALNPFISVGIKTLGRFVQMLSEVAISEDRVPGLAAMQPAGATVKRLNGAQGGLDRLARYYGITSNFVATLQLRNGLTHELGQLLLDRVTNRLFTVENDLVVDTSSMTECGTRDQRFQLGQTFAFGNTEDVYHTVYFAVARVPELLSNWLALRSTAQTGTVKWFNSSKGYGFITPDDGGGDVFVHISAVEHAGLSTLYKGQRVGFESVTGDARPAEELKIIPLERASGPPFSVDSDVAERADKITVRGLSRRRVTRASATRPPRRKEPASNKIPTSAAVFCHFAAEMEPSPRLHKPVPLFVTVSREKIDAEKSATSKTTTEPVKADVLQKITIEVIARKNARVVGESLVEVDVPGQRPETLRFEVEGIDPGVADILIEARQGPRMLVSFVLAPVFVPTDNKLLQSQGASASPEGMEPTVLRIYEIYESNSRLTLRFDLACLDPNIAVSESQQLPNGFSRDLYVKDTLNDIEQAWAASARVYDQFLLRLKATGMEMANAFLPPQVRQALWQYRNQIRAIQVISEEPLIPWELLYVTDPQMGPEGRGFLSEWGLVRWLHNTKWPTRRLALSPERVRYVIPDYVDSALQLDGAADERAMLTRQFPDAREVKAESVAVAKFLQEEAKDCDLLHFACHGEAAQKAVLNADLLMAGTRTADGIVDDPLSAQIVKSYARFAKDPPNPIVFINACQTGRTGAGLGGVGGFADAFLRPSSKCGAGAFIGALWSVDDKLAFSFADTFYSALKSGKTLVEAAREARDLAKTKQEFTWLAYTVYGNPFAHVT